MNTDSIEVVLELPDGLFPYPIRKLTLDVDITAWDLRAALSSRYNVDGWELLGSLNKMEIPMPLGKEVPVSVFQIDRNADARLYFRPGIELR